MHGATRPGEEVGDLTGTKVVVSRSCQRIPCFSPGVLFNAADGVTIQSRRSKDGSFQLCVGWILFPILPPPPEENQACRHRDLGLPPRLAGTDVNAYSGTLMAKGSLAARSL